MKSSAHDRRILTLASVFLVVGCYVWLYFLPEREAHARLEARLEAAGREPAAWAPRIDAARRELKAAEAELEGARERFATGLSGLRREQPNASSEVRTKPGSLAALNRSVAASGAKIMAATTGDGRSSDVSGVWCVTFLATYDEMRTTLRRLSEEPGVLVRRIDRIAAEDAGAKPIWKLIVEM